MLLPILITGIVAGLLPGLLKLDKAFSVTNIAAGIAGALIGAFLGFGDAPVLLENPWLNEKSLMVAGAILFVVAKVSLTRKRIAP